MLLPKRVKYRRVHRGRMKGKASRGNTVTYGEWGLQAIEPPYIFVCPFTFWSFSIIFLSYFLFFIILCPPSIF